LGHFHQSLLLLACQIENDLVNLIEKDMKCALVGDFNAKTGFF
jgi:hypothetical protein